MGKRNKGELSDVDKKIMKAVADESRPFTDPQAGYPFRGGLSQVAGRGEGERRPAAVTGDVLARRVAAGLAAREPVVVSVAGYGRGWYVTAVDWARRRFTVYRGGDPVDVAWSAVVG